MGEDRRPPQAGAPERPPTPAAHRLPGDVSTRLVRRARAGDPQAFAQVIEHYDRRLRGFAHRLLDGAAPVDDVLATAYLRAYRALPRLDVDRSPGAWLYRITYLVCIDRLRRVRGRDRAEHRPDDDDAPVAAALRALPVDRRALVLMIDGDGFDYRAAGEVLDLPPAALAAPLERARATLRAALAEAPS